MKPGSRDRKYKILINGKELAVFKEICADLPESFGLDRRIEAYQGTRPIGFWRWDLDCLVDVLALELTWASDKPPRRNFGRVPRTSAIFAHLEKRDKLRHRKAVAQLGILESLYARFKALREEAFKDLEGD